jgi:hypothetical protein
MWPTFCKRASLRESSVAPVRVVMVARASTPFIAFCRAASLAALASNRSRIAWPRC